MYLLGITHSMTVRHLTVPYTFRLSLGGVFSYDAKHFSRKPRPVHLCRQVKISYLHCPLERNRVPAITPDHARPYSHGGLSQRCYCAASFIYYPVLHVFTLLVLLLRLTMEVQKIPQHTVGLLYRNMTMNRTCARTFTHIHHSQVILL